MISTVVPKAEQGQGDVDVHEQLAAAGVGAHGERAEGAENEADPCGNEGCVVLAAGRCEAEHAEKNQESLQMQV